MGRADYMKLGDWNALCDRCQRKYKASELRKEWTGWMVCDSCWEPRHPQEFLKGRPDKQNVAWTRPEVTEIICVPYAVPGTAIPGCAVPGHVIGESLLTTIYTLAGIAVAGVDKAGFKYL